MIKCQVQGKHSSDQVPRAESLPIPDLSQSGKLRQSHLSKMQLSIQQCCNAQKPNSSFIIGIMHGIPPKTFFQLHESLIWWHLNLQVQARVEFGGKSTHLETSGYAWICLANAALLVSVWGQKQISYFSSKCTGVNARCLQGLLQSSECSIWPFWNKGARQIAGLWPPQVL